MAAIAIFHSALRVREGVRDAARRLREAGHDPHIVDYYGGYCSFDDHAVAADYVNQIGFPALIQAAADGVVNLPDGFAVRGFSNGSGMAKYVATAARSPRPFSAPGRSPLATIGDHLGAPGGFRIGQP